MKNKILCLDDDKTTQTLVAESIKDFDVVAVGTIEEAEKLMHISFDGFLLDIELPDGDGLRFAEKLSRQKDKEGVPILFLSSHSEIANKVMAFSLGAEDFIGKPFDPIELNLRLTSKIKKYKKRSEIENQKVFGNLIIDYDRRGAFQFDNNKEKDLGLTAIEFKILSIFTNRIEQVYSRDQIMDLVWRDTFISDRTVDSHVSHLRKKIEVTKLKIETSKSFGYKAVLAP